VGAEIILRRVELRLAHEHRAAHGTVSTRPTLLVEFRQMHDGTAVSGWGECPALPDPGYFHEYTDGAQAMLTNLLIPAVVAGGSLSPDAVDAATAIAPGHPMARSALALAAEDLTAPRRTINAVTAVGGGPRPAATRYLRQHHHRNRAQLGRRFGRARQACVRPGRSRLSAAEGQGLTQP
jgi:L-alanine-DL-glutamate epimerase-like enolase superfamily enzyme